MAWKLIKNFCLGVDLLWLKIKKRTKWVCIIIFLFQTKEDWGLLEQFFIGKNI